jgi:hypothetical protein
MFEGVESVLHKMDLDVSKVAVKKNDLGSFRWQNTHEPVAKQLTIDVWSCYSLHSALTPPLFPSTDVFVF